MKIAIVHDYLVADGGAEKCLRAFMEIFPEAPIFTLFYYRERFRDLEGRNIQASFLDKIPFLKKKHHLFLPLYAPAIESLRLEGYDIILTSSWAWSKGIKKSRNTCHICYCYTPMRFAHYQHMREIRLADRNTVLRRIAERMVERLKAWDLKTPDTVDYFISTCENVRRRIKKIYGRDSAVIHPPVETDIFMPAGNSSKGTYFLIVSRLVPYKRVDIAVKAFNNLKLPLKVVGTGSEYNCLRRIAGPNIEFLDYVGQERLAELYRNCTALIFPQEEDWGIAALEAQACGRPVIAYCKGGALEYVIGSKTGHFFHDQSVKAMMDAVKEFQKMEFDPQAIRQNTAKYDKKAFKERIAAFVNEKYAEFKETKEDLVQR
ncbi:glycosyltransferase [Omnitrophica bacterium]|nr:glycosyltransferase [Candidatus Omnitrophota bacterium]